MTERSSSPLSSHIQTGIMDRSSPLGSRKGRKPPRKGRLSEPLSIVSADSMNRTRPKMARSNAKQPVNVEGLEKRFSSMRAERDQANGGSEQWIDVDIDGQRSRPGSRLMGREESGFATQRSSMSGPAFL
jgi:hypothetical protein